MKFEIGIDIVDIARIDSILKKHSFSFLFRILRPCEIFLALKSPHFIESNFLKSTQFKKEVTESNLLESSNFKKEFIESTLQRYAKFYKNIDSKNPYFSIKKLENLDSKIFKSYLKNEPLDSIKSLQFCEIDTQKSSNIDNILESFPLESFRIQTIAGFFSIKEATSKALGCGISSHLNFKDMCIFKDKNGKPHMKINKNKKQLFKIKHISISITHEKTSVVTTAIATFKR